jgi:EAL domain-containing protein (putative c-di-GMP-specific phosphodiesterase class I)
MRWNHPERGFVPPLKFISLAEGASLIAPLSERLIDMAVAQCKKWQEKQPELRLCVNFSIVHSYQEGVVDRIASILQKHDFAPQSLIVEINEKDTISDQTGLLSFINRLQALGFGVALDDFGSGMSSMSQMRSIPVDFVKIDRSVVRNICESEYDRAIVSFLANLPIDAKMVCEGVETQEQLDTVKSLGINICQGYLLSRPLPPEELKF